MNVSTTSSSPRDTEDRDYQRLVTDTRGAAGWPLFTTDATGLYELFLSAIPAHRSQHYQCRACRKFVERYGHLVTIGEDGRTHSLLWTGDRGSFFREADRRLRMAVETASINGVFLSSERTWGLASNTSHKSGVEWHHLHIQPSGEMVRRGSPLKTDEQAMAEKLEDRGILCRGLAEFPLGLVRQAHTLLTTGGLYRSEKCIGVAKWLLDLHESLATTKNKNIREDLVWRAVALAPPGFCHVRTTMIGTLLEDLAAGKPFEAIKASFDSKMSPIQYQRPQAAPTDGQLAAAEAVVSKLASAGSLARRYATLEEVLPHAIWTPKAPKPAEKPGSVFGHLKANGKTPSPIDVPAQPMTWDKFSWTVLPTVEKLELLVPRMAAPFFAFVTAADPNAPPILQWDTEEKRNPVSWYLYHGGSMGRSWGLTEGEFHEVDAVTLQPSGWTGSAEHHGEGVYLIVRGAHDLNGDSCGVGLFPEILKSDYRAIRSAMEAYSRSQRLGGKETATACGLSIHKGSQWNKVVRATVAGARVLYRLDRWD